MPKKPVGDAFGTSLHALRALPSRLRLGQPPQLATTREERPCQPTHTMPIQPATRL